MTRLLLLPFCIQALNTTTKQTREKPRAGPRPRKIAARDPCSTNSTTRTPKTSATKKNVNHLWKSRCISTGSDVQNKAFQDKTKICPTSMQARRNPCPGSKLRRKPLMLWSKRHLSTVNAAFTYYYQLCIHIFCLHKQSSVRRGKPFLQGVFQTVQTRKQRKDAFRNHQCTARRTGRARGSHVQARQARSRQA